MVISVGYTSTFILASLGIASNMETVASKVLIKHPHLMMGFIEKIFALMNGLYTKKAEDSI